MSTYIIHQRLLFALVVAALLNACSVWERDKYVEPNYDHLIGKNFSSAIFQGRMGFRVISETEIVEELEERRGDGCSTKFKVRKSDDVIIFWKVEPSPASCKVHTVPLNR